MAALELRLHARVEDKRNDLEDRERQAVGDEYPRNPPRTTTAPVREIRFAGHEVREGRDRSADDQDRRCTGCGM